MSWTAALAWRKRVSGRHVRPGRGWPLRVGGHALTAAAAVLILAAPRAAGTDVPPDPQSVTSGIKSVGRAVKQGVQTAQDAATKFARYLRNAPIMRGHHDGGDLDPGTIGDFLRKRGIGSSGAARQPPVGAGRAEHFPVASYPGSYNWPLEAGIVSSEFGPRWGKFHAGIDIAADDGEPVLASAPGVVIYAGNGLSGYGNVVIIRNDANTTTLYGHNSRLDVREGETVKQGQRIARVGSTGRSTGPHVHFEIRNGDKAVNPRDRLAANKYIGK
jgi:murein DD-endopeptidase MepM/ murein hydrolase activator NlpD